MVSCQSFRRPDDPAGHFRFRQDLLLSLLARDHRRFVAALPCPGIDPMRFELPPTVNPEFRALQAPLEN